MNDYRVACFLSHSVTGSIIYQYNSLSINTAVNFFLSAPVHIIWVHQAERSTKRYRLTLYTVAQKNAPALKRYSSKL